MQETINFKLNRILAALIDGLVILLIATAASIYPFIEMMQHYKQGSLNASVISIFIITAAAGLLLGIVYLFVTFVIFKNASLGMRITHLAFVTYDGKKPSKATLLNRSALVMVTFLLSLGLVVLANFVSVLCNDSGRNFYDIFAKIKMVNSYDL